jgi:PIN domain nuclease of toxin-antitoxin system
VAQFLLDTHALLWFIQGDPQLSDQARSVMIDNTNQLYLSVASL